MGCQEGEYGMITIMSLIIFFLLQVGTKEVVDLEKIPSLNVIIERTYLNNPIGARYIVEGKRVLCNRRGDGHYYKV